MGATEMAGQFLFGGAATRDRPQPGGPALADPDAPLAFVAVDLILIDGATLFDVPLLERKRLLESVMEEGELVRRSVFVRPPIDTWLTSWRALGFRSLAYKDANSRYVPGGVSDAWAIAPMPTR
jgi:ATP-dependent DNA ligase